jgi:8-oxo-dGTP pyrophosphatase MutT (NUDIX family)
MRKKYVLLAVFNPALTHVVCLTKLRGPAFLIGKTCFVGGQVEAGEALPDAAARELKEEAGLTVAPESFHLFDFLQREDAEMTSFAAISNELFLACQCDDEPIFIVEASLAAVEANPEGFAPDFATTLTAALTKLREVGHPR